MTGRDEGLDPFELLRLGDPIAGAEIPSQDSEFARKMKLNATGRPLTPGHGGPGPGRVRVLAAVVAALVAVGAGWALLSRSPSYQTDVVCFQEPDLEASRVGLPASSLVAPQLCASVWASDGVFGGAGVSDSGVVPPLVGCVSDSGVLFVFPSQDSGLCVSLGLVGYEAPDSDQQDVGPSDAELQNKVSLVFAGVDCPTFEAAGAELELILEEYPGWVLGETGPPTDSRPCAGFAIDFQRREVLLVPDQSR